MLLVDAAIQTGQRALVGKVNMTSASHYDYQETAEENVQNTIEFVRAVLGRKVRKSLSVGCQTELYFEK